ncbi:inositol monophosphatase [Alphaproteobacteria bacterium HT1-32]|nr:inositol monophosphatase [Alphaproteobacteria bacterium HT1-32]|tara:strand:- start:15228 stop:16040 length:813 start_codon:yes stop_codon:yes gene_type:complete
MARRSALINVMANAADKAGRRLVRDFGEVELLQVSMKGPGDFVSSADLRAERTIKAELRKARPDFGFLMEESGSEDGADSDSKWIVDPLDGTTNFLHGIPNWCISIALEKQGEIVAGVVYQPVGDQMFWAEKGEGAFLNNQRLRVSARKEIGHSLFATGIPWQDKGDHETYLKQLGAVMKESAGIRRIGSAALDLAYVAAGKVEGYWEEGINAWDVAAGIIMVREAGGYVTELDGKENVIYGRSILAANDRMHGKLKRLLRNAVREPKPV